MKVWAVLEKARWDEEWDFRGVYADRDDALGEGWTWRREQAAMGWLYTGHCLNRAYLRRVYETDLEMGEQQREPA